LFSLPLRVVVMEPLQFEFVPVGLSSQRGSHRP
jgi:hypothetical protein